jgi:membrane protease YdiL (CAAX protease family)
VNSIILSPLYYGWDLFSRSYTCAFKRFQKITAPLKNPFALQKQQQLDLISVGIASATLLSIARIFPSYVFKITCMSPVFFLMPYFLGKGSKVTTHPVEQGQLPPDVRELLALHPTESCLIYPIFQEIVYRGMIQNGLHVVFRRLLPNVTFSLFGAHFSLATVLAMGIASVIFGAKHKDTQNPTLWNKPARHAFRSFISFAYFFHSYGIGASIFAHSLHNTINCAFVRWRHKAYINNCQAFA